MRIGSGVLPVVLTLGLAACAGSEEDRTVTATIDPKASTVNTGVERYDIQLDGQRFDVQILNRADADYEVFVTRRGFRGLDRADIRFAFTAAQQAAAEVSCPNGQRALTVDGPSAIFFDEENAQINPLVRGEPYYQFGAACV